MIWGIDSDIIDFAFPIPCSILVPLNSQSLPRSLWASSEPPHKRLKKDCTHDGDCDGRPVLSKQTQE